MIKYRTIFDKIEAIEIDHETDKQVVLCAGRIFGTRRQNKVSDLVNWHNSWDEAYAFLIHIAEKEVNWSLAHLENCKIKLEKIKNIKRPTE